MKTKEFIKKVEELGFEVWINSGTAYILNDKTTIVKVKIDKAFVIDCFYLLNWTLEEEIREKLFDLIVEYASTPVKDREEEKKFYLEHKYFKCIDGDSRYFQIYELDGTPWLNVMDSIMGCCKKQFTLNEIEDIKEKFDTDLADFELVEVKDEF